MDIAKFTRGVSAGAVEAELQAYVKEKDLDGLFVGIVENLLMAKPDNPVQFVIDYLTERFPDQVAAPAAGFDGTQERAYEDDDSDSEGESDDEDYVDELPALKAATTRKVTRRRTAVSAESGVDLAQLLRLAEERKVPKSADDAARLHTMLSRNMLFSHLDDAQVRVVVDTLMPVTFAAGDVVIREGEEGDLYYLVDTGNADVYVADRGESKAEDSESDGAAPRRGGGGGGGGGGGSSESKDGFGTKVLTCGAGDSFGELALMYNAPRAATVVAATDLATWALDRVTFKALMVDTTERKRERYRGFLASVPLLSTLTETERMQIADALTPVRFEAGQSILRQGEPGHTFFLIEEGEVAITKRTLPTQPPREVLRLHTGGYFGEIALLTAKPRQANAIAVTDSKCLALDRATFQRVMGTLTDLLKRNMEQYEMIMRGQI